MPRHINPPKTLKEIYGTFEAYMEATKGEHNKQGYKSFLRHVNPSRKRKYSASQCAEDFNVSRSKWYDMLKWYAEDQSIETAQEQQLE